MKERLLRKQGRSAGSAADGWSRELEQTYSMQEQDSEMQRALDVRPEGLWPMSGEYRLCSCSELREGEWIAALRNGTVHFVGKVGESMPRQGLFWATSATGERRIIEFQEYDVLALQTLIKTAKSRGLSSSFAFDC